MSTILTAESAQESLAAHVTAKGIELFARFSGDFTRDRLQRVLDDRTVVRYPCELVFDAAELLPGEFAYPKPRGAHPEDGFTLFVHPSFAHRSQDVAALVLYQLVAVNYGAFASASDAELFGAAALGLTRDEYYAQLCAWADELLPPDAAAISSCGCGSGTDCG